MVDQQLIDLRQHSLEVAGKFLGAQHAYLDASQAGRPHEELSQLAEVAALAAEQHGAALETLLNFLSTADSVQDRGDEIERTKSLIHAAEGEANSLRQLVSHHASEARR